MIHELGLQVTVFILPQSSPTTNSMQQYFVSAKELTYNRLRIQNVEPQTQPSTSFAFLVLHFSYLLWRESQPPRVKLGSLRFYLKSFITLILFVEWITTLTEFSSLYHPQILHFQRKYLKMQLLEYPNIVYCAEFCFMSFAFMWVLALIRCVH